MGTDGATVDSSLPVRADCSQPGDVHVPRAHKAGHEVLEGLTQFWSPPVYAPFALRRVFRESRPRTVSKFAALVITY